ARRPGEGNPAIGKLYARERVADLEARSTVGEDADREIEALGLRFQISTRLTSWVAIDERRRATGPGRTEDMPQELPYGTTAASFGLRGPMQEEEAELGMNAFAVQSAVMPAPRAFSMEESKPRSEPERIRASTLSKGRAAPPSSIDPFRAQGVMASVAMSPARKRSRLAPFLLLLLLLGGIAALLWWLVR
ncbi:MAG TPA: hypothetical protein VK932_08395, partial [Kofleriaceae bacterium]|nr:hypothetical protein [Kofleriaceae bacterium]